MDELKRYERKFRRIARGISPLEIQAMYSQSDLSWDDLFQGDRPASSQDLFLGNYSRDGISFIIERFGFDRLARHRGIRHLNIQLDCQDPFRHVLRIYDDDVASAEHLIMEFVARLQTLTPSGDDEEFIFTEPLQVLMVEWLILQNPRGSFTTRRPQLPGQLYPGLGLGDPLMALFTLMGRHLHVDGIVNVPEHFHTALMFSRRFKFLDARVQAIMEAISRDLWGKYRLAVIAWACYHEAIRDIHTGQTIKWNPRKQIIPLKGSLRTYFHDPEYQQLVDEQKKRYSFRLDEDLLRSRLEAMDQPPITI